MFKAKNFCHVASNNRNNVKVGVFTYRTTDDLASVLVSGYFNERIIDINLHDLIIHEKIDATDNTKVERNLLCVVQRTLDNVGTAVIQSKWEGDIEQEIEDIVSQLDNFVLKTGDTMTGALNIIKSSSSDDVLLKIGNSTTASYQWNFVPAFNSPSLSIFQGTSETNGYRFSTIAFLPATNNNKYLGGLLFRWKATYTGIINNGGDLIVPENTSGTLATKADVDLAANSGDQLYSTGVWYAKMYAATTPPASAEVEGRNYADFSQTDGSGNPVIKVYTYTSGSWTLTDTIVPPSEYNGYMTITSKIWDISEQTGQQGGKVLWSHNQKTFTPYPQIISFENAALTGVSTAPTPSTDDNSTKIATTAFVKNALDEKGSGSGRNIGDTFMTKRTDTSLAGAVECDGATYNTTDFTGDGSIGELLEAGKLDYISLSAYSTAISTKGWCDKIGWDGTGNTVFRVPTLNAHIVQTNNIPVVGNGITLGITSNGANAGLFNSSAGAIAASPDDYGTNVSTTHIGAAFSNNKTLGVTTDATKSGIIADTTDTAQLRVMIQIANSATDEALETCTSVLADVAALKYDYVVDFQRPTAENGYTWYRKYKSGWVEQGGTGTAVGTSGIAIVLPVEMSDAHYSIQGTCDGNSNGGKFHTVIWSSQTATGFMITPAKDGVFAPGVLYWQVSGMAAS